MPQFDIAVYPGLIFWLFIVFGLLYVAVRWVFLDRIRGSIVHRQSTLDAWLSEAQELRDNAARIAVEDERKLKEAKDKALACIADALAKAKEQQQAEEQALLERLEAKQSEVRRDMQKTWDDWQGEIQTMAGDLTDSIMKKIGDSSSESSSNKPRMRH